MALLREIILFIVVLESKKKIVPSHLIEDCFYLIIGIVLAILRARKKKNVKMTRKTIKILYIIR